MMDKVVSLALLAAGVLLLVFGVGASKSIGSSLSRIFTGAPTDKAIWLLAGGVVLCIIGLAGVLRKS